MRPIARDQGDMRAPPLQDGSAAASGVGWDRRTQGSDHGSGTRASTRKMR